MVKTEVKNRLLNKIKEIEDLEIIHEIYRLLEIDLEESLYITSEAQKKALDHALHDVKKGNVLTEEEANKRTAEWLNKKS